MPVRLSQEELLIINLLLRIAVMAGIVSLLLGFRFVVDFIMRRSVSVADRLRIAGTFAAVFIIGIVVRKLTNQGAMDLSLEGALFAGFFGGVWIGTGVGAAIGAVCYLFREPVALPFYTAAGFMSGFLVAILGSGGEIWNYSLNPLSMIYNFLENLWRRRLDRNFIPFAALFLFAAARYVILERTWERGLLYGFLPQNNFTLILELISVICSLGIALKLANNARIELLLREEEHQLMHARLVTLRSQINPHFLFNTLNSISALIRTDAERAREMTRQLASIFRKALDENNDTHSLRDEIAFIDDYLAIERVRFGDERLRVVKDLDQAAIDAQVPVMILQPLIENAIKHGISRRLDGGTIRINARPLARGIEIEIENDGVPFADCALDTLLSRGLGLRNVIERITLYTCGEGRLAISPRPSGGAVVRLSIPPPLTRSVDRCPSKH
jgi:two-component system LytT family sensor kinase